MGEEFIYIVTWVVFCTIVGAIGSDKKIGFTGAFFLSLILSPLIGLIITLFSKSLDSVQIEKEVLINQKEQTKLLAENNKMNIANEIERLANLRDNGVITEDEFQQAKQRLIN